MDRSILEQYRVSDLLEWRDQGKLMINHAYQRGSVWSPTAKVFFIDSILRGIPVPKMYFRTIVNLQEKRSYREVVDGQQRLRALEEFSKNGFKLTKRAREFSGLGYDDLDEELKGNFLSYPIGVAQLINASDDDVLEVFSRINSYTVSLNDAEQRHAQFQGDFKWAVRDEAREATPLWDEFGIFTKKDRIRMQDDSYMAEMFGIVAEGVQDGGQPKIKSLYERLDRSSYKQVPEVQAKVRTVWQYMLENMSEGVAQTALSGQPHFLMLYAAVAHALVGVPDKGGVVPPTSTGTELTDMDIVLSNLGILSRVIDSEKEPESFYAQFWSASKSSTQRVASRKIRFPMYFSALQNEPLPSA